MARLFVAAWPPPPVLDELERLRRPQVAGVRWTTREQWHVTLRFLGDADADAATDAVAAVRTPAATAELGPTLEALGRSVLVAPVAGLDRLADAVRDATAGVGDPPDPRPFRGHVTVARRRQGSIRSLAGTAVGATFAVDEIALVESDTRPGGARYHDVCRVLLAAT